MSGSLLDKKIANFITEYGSDVLIEYIDDFETLGGPVKYRKFKKLEAIACSVYNLTLSDVRNLSNTETTDVRRIISHISQNLLGIDQKLIARLLGNLSQRSVSYYINEAETWINDSRSNKIFFERYQKVIERFNSET